MNMKNKIITVLVLAGLMVVTSAKATTVVFDNITGITHTGQDNLAAIGPIYGSFTSAGTAQQLTSLELQLWGPSTFVGAGTITIGLYSDSSTSPGALITSTTILESAISGGYNNYFFSLGNPLLAASARYWIGLSDTGQAVGWAWTHDVSGPGVSGEWIAHSGSPGVWDNPPNGGYMMKVVEDVRTNGVPDAGSTASLLGLALAGLIGLRRKLA
jgi:hypothetical protein